MGGSPDINGYGYAKLFIYNNLDCGSVYEPYKRSDCAVCSGCCANGGARVFEREPGELLFRIFAAQLASRCRAERCFRHSERQLRADAGARAEYLSVGDSAVFLDSGAARPGFSFLAGVH